MGYAEYFADKNKDTPRPKFDLGTRVFGRFSGVPFIGTVVREQDKRVLIHTDLPVKVKNDIHNIVTVLAKDIKKLVEF
jgi:hypothetical protein